MPKPGPEAGAGDEPPPPVSDAERDAAAFARDRPPPGFRIYWSESPFSGQHGPYYQRFEAERSIRGFRAARKHCNSAGILHGGMLVSFLDGLMGLAVWRAIKAMPLTIRLVTDFVSIARPGDWVEGAAWVTEETDGTIFVRGEIVVGARTVMTAQGLFAAMARHAGAPR